MEKEFLTRSDTPGTKHSGTKTWNCFLDAYNAWKEDDSIWKLSFKDPRGLQALENPYARMGLSDQQGINMRWRPKTKKDIWENEDCLDNLSVEYANEIDIERVYWVWQHAMSPIFKELNQKLDNGEITWEEFEKLNSRTSIQQVLTDEEFLNQFRNL